MHQSNKEMHISGSDCNGQQHDEQKSPLHCLVCNTNTKNQVNIMKKSWFFLVIISNALQTKTSLCSYQHYSILILQILPKQGWNFV